MDETKLDPAIFKLAKKKTQEIERGLRRYGEPLYPPVKHILRKEDLEGKKGPGLLTITPFDPSRTSAEEVNLAVRQLKLMHRVILRKNPPQKRLYPKHDRDKELAEEKKLKKEVLSNLAFEDTQHIDTDEKLDKKHTEAVKRAKKKYIQAKYRFTHPR